jgi:hypothetical protein
MDQGIIATIQEKYQHRLHESLIEVTKEGGEMLEKWKEIKLKTIYWTAPKLARKLSKRHWCFHRESYLQKRKNKLKISHQRKVWKKITKIFLY